VSELVPWLPLITAVVVAVIGGAYGLWNKGKTRPPTWPEMWERMEAQDKRLNAAARIIRSISEQWPEGHPAPTIAPSDVKELEGEDTIPVKWLTGMRQVPPSP
jgi:hypothetical protein